MALGSSLFYLHTGDGTFWAWRRVFSAQEINAMWDVPKRGFLLEVLYYILGLYWCYIMEQNMETTIIVGIRCFCNLNLNGNNY